jgi:hypothetical protein
MAVGTKTVLVVEVAVVVVVVVVVVTVSVCGGLLEDGSGVDGVLQVLHDPVPCAAANMIPHSATSMVTSLYVPLCQPRYPLRYRITTRGWLESTSMRVGLDGKVLNGKRDHSWWQWLCHLETSMAWY